LPSDLSVVVANTLVTANKYHNSDNNYNKRVVECRLAAVILSKKHKISNANNLKTLYQFQEAAGKTLEECLALVDLYLPKGEVTKEEILLLMGMKNIDEVDETYGRGTVIKNNTKFKLFDRAKHVFSESLRVFQFFEICQKQQEKEKNNKDLLLGNLLNESHYSNRDLFDVSCDELEELTSVCRRNGALGSRMTGAGFGGCVVCLVKKDVVSSFCDAVYKGYYEKDEERKRHKRENVLFATSPSSGAFIINI